MRWLAWLAASALGSAGIAGCADEPASVDVLEETPAYIVLDPIVLVAGTFRWHETGSGTANLLEYYDLASQAIAHPCVWDGGGRSEPYFNNRHLPSSSGQAGDWSGNVTFTLDWTQQDWLGSALRVAYRAPGVAGWQETEPIDRGTPHTEAIRVHQENDTDADDESEDGDGSVASDWDVWLCLPTDTGVVEQPFMGSVTASAVFQPDPILEDELAAEADADGRTARTG